MANGSYSFLANRLTGEMGYILDMCVFVAWEKSWGTDLLWVQTATVGVHLNIKNSCLQLLNSWNRTINKQKNKNFTWCFSQVQTKVTLGCQEFKWTLAFCYTRAVAPLRHSWRVIYITNIKTEIILQRNFHTLGSVDHFLPDTILTLHTILNVFPDKTSVTICEMTTW